MTILTAAERHTKYPAYIVILFDELCKAHSSALDKLMSLLTNGKQDCTSSKNFKLPTTTGLLVIFTGNFGDRKILKETSTTPATIPTSSLVFPSSLVGGNLKIGYDDLQSGRRRDLTTTTTATNSTRTNPQGLLYDEEYLTSVAHHDRYLQAVRKEMIHMGYSPAHIIRLGKIVPFKPISLETVKKVALLELEKRLSIVDTYQDLKQRYQEIFPPIPQRKEKGKRGLKKNNPHGNEDFTTSSSKAFYTYISDNQCKMTKTNPSSSIERVITTIDKRGDVFFFAYRQDVDKLLDHIIFDCSNHPEYGMRYLLNKLRTNVDEFVTDAKSLLVSTVPTTTSTTRGVLLLSLMTPSSSPSSFTHTPATTATSAVHTPPSSTTTQPSMLILLAWVLREENMFVPTNQNDRQNATTTTNKARLKPVTRSDNLLTSKIIF